MSALVYVEESIRDHPRARALLERFRSATVVPIERYGEVFNHNRQSFRLQKKDPSWILARKHGTVVHSAPDGYGIGGGRSFYFSHVLNCPYDCRYCFLQGMYRSAHYVWFVNYEDMQDAIKAVSEERPGETTTFFSGYDGDSLALDAVTGFVDAFLPFFASLPNATLELRTKSAVTRPLLARAPGANVVVAYSFTPEEAGAALEDGVPPPDQRLDAMRRLGAHGYRLGLRFDPLLYARDFENHYRRLFETVFASLETEWIHSVSFGPFRTPRGYFERMRRLYPEERLFAGLDESGAMVSYPEPMELEMRRFCESELRRFVPEDRLFPCRP